MYPEQIRLWGCVARAHALHLTKMPIHSYVYCQTRDTSHIMVVLPDTEVQ